MKDIVYKVQDGKKIRFAVVEYVNKKRTRVMDEWDYLPAAVMSACEWATEIVRLTDEACRE